MRIPRFILNPAVSGWIRLYQHERRELLRVRRELAATQADRDEWRDRLLQKVNVTPLFTPKPPPLKPAEPLIVGIAAKKRHLDNQRGPVNIPTVEELMRETEQAS